MEAPLQCARLFYQNQQGGSGILAQYSGRCGGGYIGLEGANTIAFVATICWAVV